MPGVIQSETERAVFVNKWNFEPKRSRSSILFDANSAILVRAGAFPKVLSVIERKSFMSPDLSNLAAGVMSPAEAARYIGVAVSTLAKMRCWGGGPEFLKLGRKVAYERTTSRRLEKQSSCSQYFRRWPASSPPR